jgi:hypothetical protein
MCHINHSIERKVGHMVGQCETYGFDSPVTNCRSVSRVVRHLKKLVTKRQCEHSMEKQYLLLFAVNEKEETNSRLERF